MTVLWVQAAACTLSFLHILRLKRCESQRAQHPRWTAGRNNRNSVRLSGEELRQGGQPDCCLGKSQQSHRRQTAATGFRPRGASQVIPATTWRVWCRGEQRDLTTLLPLNLGTPVVSLR